MDCNFCREVPIYDANTLRPIDTTIKPCAYHLTAAELAAKDAEIAALQGVIDRVRGECLKDANDRHGPGDAWERGVAFTRAAILALLPPTGGES